MTCFRSANKNIQKKIEGTRLFRSACRGCFPLLKGFSDFSVSFGVQTAGLLP